MLYRQVQCELASRPANTPRKEEWELRERFLATMAQQKSFIMADGQLNEDPMVSRP